MHAYYQISMILNLSGKFLKSYMWRSGSVNHCGSFHVECGGGVCVCLGGGGTKIWHTMMLELNLVSLHIIFSRHSRTIQGKVSKCFPTQLATEITGGGYSSHFTHWSRVKMAAISQTAFLNASSWKKLYELRLTFHWSVVELTTFQHWFVYWLGADQATSQYLNQWYLIHWRIYASLGLNELISPLSNFQNTCDVLWITFISDGCYRSRVTEALVEYGCDSW